MAADVDPSASNPRIALLWEAVLTARAERRLVEFELTRRRTLLTLSVVLSIGAVIVALIGEPAAGVPIATGALAFVAAGFPRGEDR